MRDNSLIISLLIGLIVILVIAGVSLLVKMNALSVAYKQEVAKNINFEKAIDDLKKNIGQFNSQIAAFTKESLKLEELKIKMKKKLDEVPVTQAAESKSIEENTKEEVTTESLGEQ